MNFVLKKPLISEKNTVLAEAGVYVFEVALDASKTVIKSEIEKNFGVKVSCVRTIRCRGRGKASRFGMGRIPRWKKAFVQLKAGEKIGLFEGI